MVRKVRDARILRALLQLDPPRGVTRASWRRYLHAHVQPRVQHILQDLGQPVEGPVEKPDDLTAPPATAAPRERRAPTGRRRVAIREELARIIDAADPLLGRGLEERVDTLLVMALADRPTLRAPPPLGA